MTGHQVISGLAIAMISPAAALAGLLGRFQERKFSNLRQVSGEPSIRGDRGKCCHAHHDVHSFLPSCMRIIGTWLPASWRPLCSREKSLFGATGERASSHKLWRYRGRQCRDVPWRREQRTVVRANHETMVREQVVPSPALDGNAELRRATGGLVAVQAETSR